MASYPQCITDISIHALLAESDGGFQAAALLLGRFLSTLSLRRATGKNHRLSYNHLISIHALLAESDMHFLSNVRRLLDFYPRSPCGERLFDRGAKDGCGLNFYPRSPCGERPNALNPVNLYSLNFYPRSPCGERRTHLARIAAADRNFYPRSPCGERR